MTLLSGYYALANLSVNTDTVDMLSPDLPFRQHSAILSQAFPQFSDNIVVVVDAPTPDQAYDAANLLLTQLQKNTPLFGIVFDPITHPFFQKNGLLYFRVDELEALAERLSAAQPFLGRLNQSPALPEFFRLLSQIVVADTPKNDLISQNATTALFHEISRAVEGKTRGPKKFCPGAASLAVTGPASANRRIIVLQPKTDFASLSPGAEAMMKSDDWPKASTKERFAAGVRITGSLALAQKSWRVSSRPWPRRGPLAGLVACLSLGAQVDLVAFGHRAHPSLRPGVNCGICDVGRGHSQPYLSGFCRFVYWAERGFWHSLLP